MTPGVSSVRTDILFGLLSIDNWHRLGKKLQNGVELLNRIRNLRRNRTGTTRCRPKKYWTHGSFQVSITSLVDVLGWQKHVTEKFLSYQPVFDHLRSHL
jgi:hypothetical protein